MGAPFLSVVPHCPASLRAAGRAQAWRPPPWRRTRPPRRRRYVLLLDQPELAEELEILPQARHVDLAVGIAIARHHAAEHVFILDGRILDQDRDDFVRLRAGQPPALERIVVHANTAE